MTSLQSETKPEASRHSELGPSAADKWLVCPAWRRFTVGLPKTSSAAADEGTQAHSYLESALRNKADKISGTDLKMSELLQPCLDWALQQKGIINPEVELDYGEEFGYTGLFGTADMVIDHEESLTIVDLKYGFGLVEVGANPQMMIYLVGAVAKFGERKS